MSVVYAVLYAKMRYLLTGLFALKSFKVKLFVYFIFLLIYISFFWYDEKSGYSKAQKNQITTEQQCAEVTGATVGDWIACLTVHGVYRCLVFRKPDDYFEDKGCLRYDNENKNNLIDASKDNGAKSLLDDDY